MQTKSMAHLFPLLYAVTVYEGLTAISAVGLKMSFINQPWSLVHRVGTLLKSMTNYISLVNDSVSARAKHRCTHQLEWPPAMSIIPRWPLATVHSGDVTVHSDRTEWTATAPEFTVASGQRVWQSWLVDTPAGNTAAGVLTDSAYTDAKHFIAKLSRKYINFCLI